MFASLHSPAAAEASRNAVLRPGADRAQRDAAARAPCQCAGGWDFAGIPALLQTKLAIGASDDPLEHEADRAADQVMANTTPSLGRAQPRVSRKCAACEEDDKAVQRKHGDGAVVTGEAPASVHAVLADQGRPMDRASRAFFEPRFGHDFSGIRVHDDARAAQSARQVGALAYTVGRQIVLDPSACHTGTQDWRRLMAHELAHTIQQSGPGAAAPRLSRKPRSLAETLNPATLSDNDLSTEIGEIRTYLKGQAQSSPDADQLAQALGRLGTEYVKRHPPQKAPEGPPRDASSLTVQDVLTADTKAAGAGGGGLAMGNFMAQPAPNLQPPPAPRPPLRLVPPETAPPTTPVEPVPVDPVPSPPVRPAPRALPIGPAAAGVLVFIIIMLWPNDSIVDEAAEQEMLKRAAQKQTGPQLGPAKGPQTGPGPKPVPRNPDQTCDNATLDVLQKAMHDICDKIPGDSCSPSKVSQKKLDKRPCSQIQKRIQAFRDCLAARQKIQDDCFGGKPDKRHQDEMDQLNNGLNACLALAAVNCAPGHPMANL